MYYDTRECKQVVMVATVAPQTFSREAVDSFNSPAAKYKDYTFD